ncbi:TPA: hypothetical protein LA742_003241 [Clostridium botulinum]|nr:hypothetical protein [Clostridium botulinum]
MDIVLSNIFENYNFLLQDINFKKSNIKVVTNKKSETYILVFVDEIVNTLPNKVFSLCADELYITDKLTQAQKSNLSIIIVSRVKDKLLELQKNIIYKIEESDLYYKKFVLWYSEEELGSLKQIIDNDYTPSSLNNKLVNRNLFKKFKNDKEKSKGYDLLSRIYIKLPFLTLNEIVTLNKTLTDYVQESLNKLNVGLFKFITDHLENNEIVDDSINLFQLSQKELSEIDKELESMVKLDE